MKGATQCAKRLKPLFKSLRDKHGKVAPPETTEPLTQLIIGVISRDVPESKARQMLDTLRSAVVDFNELRVVPPIEMAENLGKLRNARLKCEDISRALNSIFAKEHVVALDHLAERPKKDVCEYLDAIDGLDAYVRARIRLLGLRLHAIPLDEAMWAYAKQQEIIDPKCPLEEAQAFLERQINESDALEFVALLQTEAWAVCGKAVEKGEVEQIVSIPPDRTTRNMLRLVSTGQPLDAEEAEPPAPAAEQPSVTGGTTAAAPPPAEDGQAKSAKAARKATSADAAKKRTTKRASTGKSAKADDDAPKSPTAKKSSSRASSRATKSAKPSAKKAAKSAKTKKSGQSASKRSGKSARAARAGSSD